MKLLLDANISWRIVKNIESYVEKCIHVDNCDLKVPAQDIEIWNFAKANQFIIITNDEDFKFFYNLWISTKYRNFKNRQSKT
ncbi:MAG: DUF5615 family PIN-like protein [Saprospiraceae bacterium]